MCHVTQPCGKPRDATRHMTFKAEVVTEVVRILILLTIAWELADIKFKWVCI